MAVEPLNDSRKRDWERFWNFDADRLVLTTTAGGYEYEIDLETMRDSGRILDWIAQIANKVWASADVIGALVLALDDLLYLQQNFCSFGSTKRVPKSEIPKIIHSRTAQTRKEPR